MTPEEVVEMAHIRAWNAFQVARDAEEAKTWPLRREARDRILAELREWIQATA